MQFLDQINQLSEQLYELSLIDELINFAQNAIFCFIFEVFSGLQAFTFEILTVDAHQLNWLHCLFYANILNALESITKPLL